VETDKEMVGKVKDNLGKWMTEAKSMDGTLKAMNPNARQNKQGESQASNSTQGQGNDQDHGSNKNQGDYSNKPSNKGDEYKNVGSLTF
jgi:hypothetical protein